jgi:hypothetical protein
MEKLNLDQLWKSIVYSGSGQVSYRLMSLESIPSLNLGINKIGQRCLILELPSDLRPEIPENSKENISLWYYASENCISIVLNDSYFEDLFNDLILSIYHKIYKIEDPKTYSTHFVAYYFKWLNFLDNHNNILSKEVIKGIWGEVFYLKQLLDSNSLNVNDNIISWQGPFDKGHDFVFELLDVEVKTIDNGSNTIKISSEYQLDNDPSKKLQLAVLSVQDDKNEGITLEKLVKEVRNTVIKQGGDINAFSDALFQKGLTFGNLNQYDIYPFKPITIQHFNCCDDEFPRIIKSKLPEEIASVRYSLKLNMIQEFLITQIEL